MLTLAHCKLGLFAKEAEILWWYIHPARPVTVLKEAQNQKGTYWGIVKPLTSAENNKTQMRNLFIEQLQQYNSKLTKIIRSFSSHSDDLKRMLNNKTPTMIVRESHNKERLFKVFNLAANELLEEITLIQREPRSYIQNILAKGTQARAFILHEIFVQMQETGLVNGGRNINGSQEFVKNISLLRNSLEKRPFQIVFQLNEKVVHRGFLKKDFLQEVVHYSQLGNVEKVGSLLYQTAEREQQFFESFSTKTPISKTVEAAKNFTTFLVLNMFKMGPLAQENILSKIKEYKVWIQEEMTKNKKDILLYQNLHVVLEVLKTNEEAFVAFQQEGIAPEQAVSDSRKVNRP